uniref:NADH-ubiquinone oxidoreductase chain 3 n=1 Tax=Austrofundulus limnaeus TaxID=52670 RepID=A0A1D9CIL2_AUSLI|nr:NADH dehydrogenase subunit 3 [Austrofundulus limnaeus]
MMLSMAIVAFMLSATMLSVSFWMPLTTSDYEKLSPYECGFNPFSPARLPFSLRFFLVAIMFLIFDLEIALLLPLPWGNQLQMPLMTFVWVSIILILLTSGFAYEWAQGSLEWAE